MTDRANQIAVHLGDTIRSADDYEIGIVKSVDSQNMTVERTAQEAAYLIPISTVSSQTGGALRLNVTKEEIESRGWQAPEHR